MKAILVGSFDCDAFLSTCTFQNTGSGTQSPIHFSPLEEKSSTCQFPTEDTETGSIAYAWRGPPLQDVKSHTILDVLVRYFAESSASPMSQRFVEIKEPVATDVAM